MRRFGYKWDKVDKRDWRFGDFPPTTISADLYPSGSPVYDQGSTGSCSYQATAMAIMVSALYQGRVVEDPSVLFGYFNARRANATKVWDSGSYIRSCLKATNAFGVCPRSTWPFSAKKVNIQPSWNSYQKAAKDRLRVEYRRITDNISEVSQSIASGMPVVCGFPKLFGGPHAVVVVAVDSSYSSPCFRIVNSWGAKWGESGQKWISKEDLLTATDLWSVRVQ